MAALRAEEPRCGRAKSEGEHGKARGEPEGGEAWTGEVEEGGHGEGVVADTAMGEEIADVGDEGEMAGGPEAVGEGERDGDAEGGEGGVGRGDPTTCGTVFGVGVLGTGEGGGDEDQERKVRGEG